METYSHIMLFIIIILLIVICILAIYNYRILRFKKLQDRYFEYLAAKFTMVAHDIKSPITALKEATAIIKGSLKNNDVVNALHFVNKFENTLNKLDHTTQDVLNFGTGYNFEEKSGNVRNVIENVIDYISYFQVDIENVVIKHSVNVDNLIIKHPKGMEIIIRNWIMNAIKHSNAHSFYVNVFQEGKNLIFVIQDDGHIIENDVIQSILTAISNETGNEFTHQKRFGLFLIGTFLRFTKSSASLSIVNGKNTFSITTN